MKKVCIMTSVHPHDDVRIYHREALSLARAGYKVVILNRFFRGKDKNGIKFIRLRLPINRVGRIMSSSAAFYKAAAKINAEIYHFHDPELIPAGLALKCKGAKVIYDVHEDLPLQVLDKPWIPQWQKGAISSATRVMEEKCSHKFDACICATDEIANKFVNGIAIHNYPDSNEIFLGTIPFKDRMYDAVYAGGITLGRGINAMLEGARLGGWELALAGGFEDEKLLSNCCQHPAWAHTSYLGRIGRSEINSLLGNSRCGLLLLKPTAAYVSAFPIKLFEYMMAGLPIVASDIPLWRELAGSECAIFVSPNNAAQAAAAVNWLIQNPDTAEKMGLAGRSRAMERFNFNKEKEKLLDIYAHL